MRWVVPAVVLLVSVSAFAQDQVGTADSSTAPHLEVDAHRLNRITVGPAGLLIGFIALEYERGLSDNLSIAIGPQLQFGAGILELAGVSAFGVGSTLALRVFPLEDAHAPEGFWFGPEVHAQISALTAGSFSSASLGGGLLATIGYTMIASSGFTASFGGGLGAGYGAAALNNGQSTQAAAAWGPDLSIHFQLGRAF